MSRFERQSLMHLIDTCGAVVMWGFVLKDAATRLYQRLLRMDRSNWIDGDDSDHRWLELIQPSDLDADLEPITTRVAESLWQYPVKSACWINMFAPGQYIAAHRDADGDLQVIVPLAIPGTTGGGELWLDSPDKTIPLGVGDALLFRAARILHGTTPVLSPHPSRRCTVNLRYWFDEGL